MIRVYGDYTIKYLLVHLLSVLCLQLHNIISSTTRANNTKRSCWLLCKKQKKEELYWKSEISFGFVVMCSFEVAARVRWESPSVHRKDRSKKKTKDKRESFFLYFMILFFFLFVLYNFFVLVHFCWNKQNNTKSLFNPFFLLWDFGHCCFHSSLSYLCPRWPVVGRWGFSILISIWYTL